MWEMQLWMQTKEKNWGKSDRVPSLVIKRAVSLRLLFVESAQFFQASADTNGQTSGGTAGDRVGASKLLRSTNCSKEMRKIHEPSLQALLSFLSSPPRYQKPCLFLQRWSRQPIWMCCSGPHLLSLGFTAWYLPSVKPVGGSGGV